MQKIISKLKLFLNNDSFAAVSLARVVLWLSSLKNFHAIRHVKELVRNKPLILSMETISACNALCVFCAYPEMERKKEVQPLEIFEKVIREYDSDKNLSSMHLIPK